MNRPLIHSLVDVPLVRSLVRSLSGGGTPDNGFDDTFDGEGNLKARWLVYEDGTPASGPGFTPQQVDGRYRAHLPSTTAEEPSLWYNSDQGRFDYQTLTFPFECIFSNIGIGKADDSQTAPVPGVDIGAGPYTFCGVVAHHLTLATVSYRGWLVGHRGPTHYTMECKNTLNGVSNVTDGGANMLPLGRADIRLVGNADNTIDAYYRAPGGESWTAAPEASFENPEPFASTVHVGIVTYTYVFNGVPFVGTCDSFTLVSNGA